MIGGGVIKLESQSCWKKLANIRTFEDLGAIYDQILNITPYESTYFVHLKIHG